MRAGASYAVERGLLSGVLPDGARRRIAYERLPDGGFGSIAWLAGVTKQLGPNLSIQFAAERSYRHYSLRSGGTGFDGDNYIWSFTATLQAQF
jgi:hypothetical protein